jgi:hypothetical protein
MRNKIPLERIFIVNGTVLHFYIVSQEKTLKIKESIFIPVQKKPY